MRKTVLALATMATASVTIVSGAAGTADATFTAADLNYTPGRYIYEVGITTNDIATVYRQGVLILR